MISTPELKQRRFGAPAAEEAGANLAAALHAPNLAALRAMDAQALTDAAAAAGFAPFGVIDGHVLPRQLVDVFDRGEQAPVPLLAGFNSGEIRSLRFLAPPPPAIRPSMNGSSASGMAISPTNSCGSIPAPTCTKASSRRRATRSTAGPRERLVRKQAALGLPSFLYLFDHGYPGADAAGLHGFHASELPFVFGTLDADAAALAQNSSHTQQKRACPTR